MEGLEELQAAGWQWTQGGLRVWLKLEGRVMKVFVPLYRVDKIFCQEMDDEDCSLEPAVGDYTVAGFFKRLKRSVRRFKKRAKRAILKATRRIKKVARGAARQTIKIGRNKWFRAGLGAAAVAFPALAPAAAGLEVANRVYDRVEKGKRAALAIKRGHKTPQNLRLVKDGLRQRGNVTRMMRLARKGDRKAQQFMGAWLQNSGKVRWA